MHVISNTTSKIRFKMGGGTLNDLLQIEVTVYRSVMEWKKHISVNGTGDQ